ncbi:MAG: hypothetical protein KGJ95_10295 [Candidatus Omnitrophica bacterium]|nr:hypothetical protein [Candidatus Omnitrophota bacterium]
MKPKTFVQLGRAGDVLNILPLAREEFETTGHRPRIMVARGFASVLEGASYVSPLVWPGLFEDLFPAVWTAQHDGGEVVVPQIYGRGLAYDIQTKAFDREAWNRAGATLPWGSLPLVIDRRDPKREAKVIRDLVDGSKMPIVILCTAGQSSPFGPRYALAATLKHGLGKSHQVIDISEYRAPRIFDLLGLFERAHCIVAVDTAILHLAAAVKVPVIALTEPKPTAWHSSSWRPGQVARFHYSDFPDQAEAIVDAAIWARNPSSLPRIFHVWAYWSKNGPDVETARRITLAKSTWNSEARRSGRWADRIEFRQAQAGRTSADVGDSRPCPFARDMIEAAVAASDHLTDIVAITNADVCFVPGLTGWILEACRTHGAAFTHRHDFLRLDRPIESEADVRNWGRWYPGCDAFFFTVGWWKKFGPRYGDFVIGREFWDEVLRQLIKKTGGAEIVDAIYHEKHASFWEDGWTRQTNRGNLHNRNQRSAWFAKSHCHPDDWKDWQVDRI